MLHMGALTSCLEKIVESIWNLALQAVCPAMLSGIDGLYVQRRGKFIYPLLKQIHN